MQKKSISLSPSEQSSQTGERLPARAPSFVEQDDSFDYQTIDMEHVLSMRDIAAQIRAAEDNALSLMVQIGQNLTAAKKVLPHGSFGLWVKQACRFDQRTAARYIRVADVFGPIIDTVSNLSPSVAYIISAKRYPDDARRILIGRIATDAAITISDAKALASQPPASFAGDDTVPVTQGDAEAASIRDVPSPDVGWCTEPTDSYGSLEDIRPVRDMSAPFAEQFIAVDKAAMLAAKKEKSRLAYEDRLISLLGRRVQHDAEDFLKLLERAGWSELADKIVSKFGRPSKSILNDNGTQLSMELDASYE